MEGRKKWIHLQIHLHILASGYIEDKTLELLRLTSLFSLFVDENNEFMQKYCVKTMKFEFKFLKIIEIQQKTGATIFGIISAYLEKNQIDIKKLICFWSDGASTMIGPNIGVLTYSKGSIP